MFTFTDEPEAPENLTASNLTKDSLTLSWSPPISDGGSPIEHYVIESRTPYNPRWGKLNLPPIRGTACDLADFMEGEEREFRVIAVNEAGLGKPSQPIGPIKFKTPFGILIRFIALEFYTFIRNNSRNYLLIY